MNRTHLLGAAAAAFVAGVLAGGIAWAAIPDGGVIQGCYDSGGNLKVVAALPCPKGYTPLAWNQQGPQGLPGEDGEDGTDGQQGQPGSPGLSGYEIVSALRIVPESGTSNLPNSVTAQCPNDKEVLGGGYLPASTSSPLEVRSSHPESSAPAWTLQVVNPSTSTSHEIVVYAICASTVD